MCSVKIVTIFLFSLTVRYVKPQVREGDSCFERQLNVTGKCVLVDKCNSAILDLLNNVKPTPCAFNSRSILVCCRDGSPAENKTIPNPNEELRASVPNYIYDYYRERLETNDLRVSERKCHDMLKQVFQETNRLMSTTRNERILVGVSHCVGQDYLYGGIPAYPNEFPHMAAIGWSNPNGGYKFRCGGSLISPNFVLTAGHCTYDPTARDPVPIVVHLGDHNIDPAYKDDANPIDVPIKTIYKHPGYRPPKRYNDIALLELAESIPFNINIRPACLWSRDELFEYTEEYAVATGWGVTETGQPSKILLKVALSLLDNGPCDWLLSSVKNRNWWGFAPSQLCAGELAGGKDTCQGDSGGPLQVTGERCMYHIVGVTSFGYKCGQANRPAVYSRVISFLDWIERIVWPGE